MGTYCVWDFGDCDLTDSVRFGVRRGGGDGEDGGEREGDADGDRGGDCGFERVLVRGRD